MDDGLAFSRLDEALKSIGDLVIENRVLRQALQQRQEEIEKLRKFLPPEGEHESQIGDGEENGDPHGG